MAKLTDLPTEVLVQVFTYDVQHHRSRSEYDNPDKTEAGEYLHYLSTRKISGIYFAAIEAFWQTYLAGILLHRGTVMLSDGSRYYDLWIMFWSDRFRKFEFREAYEFGSPSPKLEWKGREMARRLRKVQLCMLVPDDLDNDSKMGVYKQNVLAYLKGLARVNDIKIILQQCGETSEEADQALDFMVGVLEQVELNGK